MSHEQQDVREDHAHEDTRVQQSDDTSEKERSIAEWTTLAISTVILVGIVGLITWLSFTGSENPPVISVEPQMESLRQEDDAYYLPVVVRNEGDLTVGDATIQGELNTGSGQPETVEFTITFLAGGEEVHGTLVFQSDPSQGELITGVSSYKEP